MNTNSSDLMRFYFILFLGKGGGGGYPFSFIDNLEGLQTSLLGVYTIREQIKIIIELCRCIYLKVVLLICFRTHRLYPSETHWSLYKPVSSTPQNWYPQVTRIFDSYSRKSKWCCLFIASRN